MSNPTPNSLKRAIVASLTGHPAAADFYRKAAANPGELAGNLASTQILTKADFLGQDEDGKPFIDAPGAWKNFAKIAELVRLGGDEFTYEDFVQPLVSGRVRTLLDSAIANDSVASIFTFDIWKGRFAEMEKLWYSLSPYQRYSPDRLVPLALKRQLLAAEGREAPEDLLAKAQLTAADIRNAATDETTFNLVNRKLQQAGDYFRKDYALIPDSSGDTMFDSKNAFSRFEAILKIMQAHGERFEVKDYTRQLWTRQSLLERAAGFNALNKIFVPAQWVDRLPDMLNLWSNVLDAWKRPPMTTQDFDNAYTEAEGQTYAKMLVEKGNLNGKADLLAPLTGANEKPVLPLGLKFVWEQFDAVKKSLEAKGEALTTADLRAVSGQLGDTCLISAAKFGRFDQVAEIAKKSGQPLTMDDFLSKDGHGNTLISILADKNQLDLVFTVDAWIGKIFDMRALWSHVSAAQRKQINFQKLEIYVKQATLKKIADGIKIVPW